MKAKIIETGRIIKVEYIGFDQTGCSMYRENRTGNVFYDIELDFDVYTIGKFLKDTLRYMLCFFMIPIIFVVWGLCSYEFMKYDYL